MNRQDAAATVITELEECLEHVRTLAKGHDDKAVRKLDDYRDASGNLVIGGSGEALVVLMEPPITCDGCDREIECGCWCEDCQPREPDAVTWANHYGTSSQFAAAVRERNRNA